MFIWGIHFPLNTYTSPISFHLHLKEVVLVVTFFFLLPSSTFSHGLKHISKTTVKVL